VGPSGPSGSNSLISAAEYVYNSTTIGPLVGNNNLVPGGEGFLINTSIFNNSSGSISTTTLDYGDGNTGTVFQLTQGIYIFDYELGLNPTGSSATAIALYIGNAATQAALLLDDSTIAGLVPPSGANPPGSPWIHGRAIVDNSSGNKGYVALCPNGGTGTIIVPTTSTSVKYIIRVTILKIA
jgi:hypothetical protein